MRSVGATLSAACALLLLAAPSARAEDGYELWLRYRPLAPSYATKVAAIALATSFDGVRTAAAAAAGEIANVSQRFQPSGRFAASNSL